MATDDDKAPIATTNGVDKTAKVNGDKKKAKEEVELSEEDQQLKSDLEMLVQRIRDSQTDIHQPSIDQLGTFIRTSTSSMTAVPKPYVSEKQSI